MKGYPNQTGLKETGWDGMECFLISGFLNIFLKFWVP
jgi:hypothetical protein